MSSASVMKSQYPAMYALMEVELRHREILRSREDFLSAEGSMDHLLQEIYGDKHEALLPRIERVDIPFPGMRKRMFPGEKTYRIQRSEFLNSQDKQDVEAVFRSMVTYKKTPDKITDEVASDNALLSYLHGQESQRLNGLDGDERLKISDQVDSLQSIRDRNTKVAALGDVITKHLPEIDPIHANGGSDATLPEKQAAYTDIIVSALASGLTNVVTYTIDDLGTDITSLPENDEKTNIHAVGHGQGGRSALMRDVIKTHHMKQVKTLVTKLKAIPEGRGTMFDNTTIIYMPETGSGHHGPDTEAPMVIMSGKNSKLDIAGRYIRLPFHGTEGHKTLSNWYTTLLNTYGNPIKHYGDLDLTMQRNRLSQEGAIDQLML